MVEASPILSKIWNPKNERMIIDFHFLPLVSSKPISMSDRNPSSPYGNNNGYYKGKYAGCSSLIRYNRPGLGSRTMSCVSISKNKSPSIGAATSYAVGRLWVLPSEPLPSTTLTRKPSLLSKSNMSLADLKPFAWGLQASNIFFKIVTTASLNLSDLPIRRLKLKFESIIEIYHI